MTSLTVSAPLAATSPATAAAPPVFGARIIIGLVGVLLAVLVSGLNEMVTKVALADIRGALHIGYDEGTWLVASYTATSVAAMAFAPWCSVTFSLRRFTLCAIGLFTLLGVHAGFDGLLSQHRRNDDTFLDPGQCGHAVDGINSLCVQLSNSTGFGDFLGWKIANGDTAALDTYGNQFTIDRLDFLFIAPSKETGQVLHRQPSLLQGREEIIGQFLFALVVHRHDRQ